MSETTQISNENQDKVGMSMDAADLLKAREIPNEVSSIVARKTFKHLGMEVEEIIFCNVGGQNKLIWCRPPFEKMEVPDDKRPNVLVHYDYTQEDEYGEYIARNRVRQAFEQHYSLRVA